MDNSNQIDELLVRYLLNELDQEEEAVVLQWLEADEKNRKQFNELKQTWRLSSAKSSLSSIDVNTEWKQLEQKISFKKKQEMQPAPVVDAVPVENPAKILPPYKIFLSTAVAACIIFIVVLGVRFLGSEKNVADKKIAVREATVKGDTVLSTARVERNSSPRARKFLLQDGTEVTLLPNSVLEFFEPFKNNRRDITLVGKAFFKVAKDKTKPFTVFSGNLSTTALGTHFSITAYPYQDFIIVRLIEGKVVVKPNFHLAMRTDKDFYLLAGEELTYDKNTSVASVKKFNENTMIARTQRENLPADSPLVPEDVKGSWYMFNNQSLDKVFQELENIYEIKIEYSKRDVKARYFIGKFDRNDSLETVLKQIALLNNLKVTRSGDKFIVKK